MLAGEILCILIEIFASRKTKGASEISAISFDAKFERWPNDNLRNERKFLGKGVKTFILIGSLLFSGKDGQNSKVFCRNSRK